MVYTRLPDFYGWCLLAERYAAWEITYDPDTALPYRARRRAQPGLVFAAADRDLFETLLEAVNPPPRVRPCLVAAEDRQRAEERAALDALLATAEVAG